MALPLASICDVFENGDTRMMLKTAFEKLEGVADVGRTVAYEALKLEGGEFSHMISRHPEKTCGLVGPLHPKFA